MGPKPGLLKSVKKPASMAVSWTTNSYMTELKNEIEGQYPAAEMQLCVSNDGPPNGPPKGGCQIGTPIGKQTR